MSPDQAEHAFECPTCRERPPLSAATDHLGALHCPRCHGALLPPRAAAALRGLLGPAVAALEGHPGARSCTCPSCGEARPLVALAAGFACSCRGCATIWVDADLAAWAEARTRAASAAPPASAASTRPGAEGPTRSDAVPGPVTQAAPFAPAGQSPTTPAPSIRRRRALLGAAVAVVGLVLAGAWLASAPGAASDSLGMAPSDHLTSPLARAVAPPGSVPGSAAEPVVAAAPTRPAAKPAPPVVLVGGRPPEWWRQRLEHLRGATDQATRALYEPTLGRARAGGLEVTQEGDRVLVQPGPERLAAAGAAP